MRPTKQLLATLLTLIMLLGLLPGAGAAELNAEYGETRYHNIASTTYSRMLMLKNNAFVAANEAGKYGLVSVTGEVTLPFQYDSLALTRDGVYLAEKDGKKLLIDAEGNVKINSAYPIKLLEKPGLYFADGKLYNPQGEVKLENVTSDGWEWFPAVPAQNGVLDVGSDRYYTADGLQESNVFVWQGATHEGAEKLKAYDTAERMTDRDYLYSSAVDYFLVKDNNQLGVTTLDGDIIIALGDFTSIIAYQHNDTVSFIVSASNGKALYSAQGQEPVNFGVYSSISPSPQFWDSYSGKWYWDGLFEVKNTSNQSGKIDASGKLILPMGNYGDRLPSLNQKGFIAAKDGEAYKLYNSEGHLVKTFDHYVATEVYYRDLVFATTLETGYGTKYGVMNEGGTTLVQPNFSSDYDEGIRWMPDQMLCAYKKDVGKTLYNENYVPVFTDFGNIDYISEGRYLLYDGDNFGIGKPDGSFAVPVSYADIRVHNPQIIELYDGTNYSLVDADGTKLVLPSTEESTLYGLNPWEGIANWAFSTNLDDTDYLKSAYDGYDGSIMPFLSKAAKGTKTTYMNYHTGEIIGTLPLEASNILPSGEFVFKDAAGKFGIGRLIQDLLPVKVTVTPPADVAYGTTLGDPAAQQQAISDGIDENATWSYLYEGTTRAGAAYSSSAKPTQAGNYTVTATLVSETHSGNQKSPPFRITPKSLSGDMLTITGSYVYTGAAITPSYTVTDGKLLTASDYTVSVTDNTAAGNGKVTITAKETGNYSGRAEKTFAIAKAPINTEKPIVIGTGAVGNVLSANLSGIDMGSVAWQWLRGGQPIVDAVERSYLLTVADSNKSISVRAEATPNGNYSGTSLASDIVAVEKQTATGTVVVTLSGSDDGTANVGSTVTAAIHFRPSVAEAGATYQWYRGETPIDSAVNAAYTITETDAGAVLKVVATAGADFTGTAQSTVAVGKKVLDGTLTLAITTDSNSDAAANVGDVMTATLTGSSAAAEDYTLVWLADQRVIESATGANYTVSATDQGKTITARAEAKGETYTGAILSTGLAVPAGVPATPQVTAQPGDSNIYFAWTVPSDNGAPITAYDVSINGAEVVEHPASGTDVLVEGLTNGTPYTITVVAKNSVGSSAVGTATATPAAPYNPGNSGGSGTTTTTTEKNADGSTTKTVIDKKTGTVTATTTWPNGDKRVVETQKDGTVTAISTTKAGLKVESVTTAAGATTAQVTLPKSMESAKVTIPVKDLKPGTVAVIVQADGKEEIVKTSVVTTDGLSLLLKADSKLKLVDNSKSFGDVSNSHWAADVVGFVTSRELFNGTGKGSFNPVADMSRAMLVTVLARLDGQDTTKGNTWYASAVDWAKEQGLFDGTALEDSISREQLAVMLYRYAKVDKVEADLKSFSDTSTVSAWAVDAMNWAVKSGIITGKSGTLDPQGNASRAEVAAMLQRFVTQAVK